MYSLNDNISVIWYCGEKIEKATPEKETYQIAFTTNLFDINVTSQILYKNLASLLITNDNEIILKGFYEDQVFKIIQKNHDSQIGTIYYSKNLLQNMKFDLKILSENDVSKIVIQWTYNKCDIFFDGIVISNNEQKKLPPKFDTQILKHFDTSKKLLENVQKYYDDNNISNCIENFNHVINTLNQKVCDYKTFIYEINSLQKNENEHYIIYEVILTNDALCIYTENLNDFFQIYQVNYGFAPCWFKFHFPLTPCNEEKKIELKLKKPKEITSINLIVGF